MTDAAICAVDDEQARSVAAVGRGLGYEPSRQLVIEEVGGQKWHSGTLTLIKLGR
jgi:hypothetical protein